MAIRKGNDAAAKLANPQRSQFRNSRNTFSFRDPDGKGPWFPSRYGGECDTCGDMFEENMEIRADGRGGWEGRLCCNDDEE